MREHHQMLRIILRLSKEYDHFIRLWFGTALSYILFTPYRFSVSHVISILTRRPIRHTICGVAEKNNRFDLCTLIFSR